MIEMLSQNGMGWISEFLMNYGLFGIFALAVMEAIFLPIPVEVLLIPFILVNPKMIIPAILVSTIGSAIGAVIGNRVGVMGEKFVLAKLVSDKKLNFSKKYFNKFGVWAIGIAALTPLPYKIFSIISGLIGIGVEKVVTVSLLSRGVRFAAVSIWVMNFGHAAV